MVWASLVTSGGGALILAGTLGWLVQIGATAVWKTDIGELNAVLFLPIALIAGAACGRLFGAGEAMRPLAEEPAEKIRRFAERYTTLARRDVPGDTPVITDKSILSYLILGLLHHALPGPLRQGRPLEARIRERWKLNTSEALALDALGRAPRQRAEGLGRVGSAGEERAPPAHQQRQLPRHRNPVRRLPNQAR